MFYPAFISFLQTGNCTHIERRGEAKEKGVGGNKRCNKQS
jgi:hypothetical protein